MAVKVWTSTTPGNWNDPTRWSGGTVPGASDSVMFGSPYNGNCTLTGNISVSSIITKVSFFTDGPYLGTIDFAGYSVTATAGVVIALESTITGLSGASWDVAGLEISEFQEIAPALRNLNLAAVWNIQIYYLGHFYYADVRNVQVNQATDFGLDYGIAAWYSEDSGNNVNVRFFPEVESPTFISGEIVGEAFLEGDIDLNNLYRFRIDGEIVGEAFLEGDIAVTEYVLSASGEIVGEAFLEGDVLISMDLQTPLSGEILGAGFLEGSPRITTPLGLSVGGSGYGGSSAGTSGGYKCQISSLGPLNYLDQSKFKLTVGNTVVDFSTPYWKPESLQVDYNGKTFSFTEVATPSYSRPSFANETHVALEMDLGSGLQTFFRGKIKDRIHHGENHAEAIQYTAFGYQNLAAELDDYGPWGITDDSFLGPWPVSVVVPRIFQNNTLNLSNNNIPATIGVPNESTFSTWTIQELSLRNSQFLSGLTQALKTEPSKRIFFDDLQGASGKWCFPDLKESDFVDLDIDLVNVDPNDFTVDTKNRWTAIKVWVPFQLPIEFDMEGSIEMLPGWDVSYEADWNIRKGMGLEGAEAFGDAYRWVFRRWTFDSGNIRTDSGGPITALFLVPYWGKTRWIPIQGDLDIANGVFISKVPLICKGNPHITDSPKLGPYAAALIYTDTETQPIPAVAWQRIPATGYTGTAYDWFGVQREKQLIVEPNAFFPSQSLEAFAQRKLDILKDAILSTEFPIVGDPIPELINLQAQVIIKNSSRGLESVPGYLTKYTYTFGKPGKSILSLSTDRTLVTRVD